jgi:fructan beta-fructosidase
MNNVISLRLPVIAVVLMALAMARSVYAADDLLIADFEGSDYAGWTASGDAFGTGPAHGTFPGQRTVSGFLGKGLVNSFLNGEKSQGTLTSPPIGIRRRYINFLIGGGSDPAQTGIKLLVDGKMVRTAAGDDDEHLEWFTWDLGEFAGKTATIQIFDRASGGWGHILIDQIVQSDSAAWRAAPPGPLYGEAYRPRFHFTASSGWINDPNGLVFFGGEYHLFFQHNPKGNHWGNMTWGHAVSPDLVHWTQLPDAIEPDSMGTIFSGSAVVDWNNTAGFQSGATKTLIAMYTAAGGTSPESRGRRFTQCIAYSNDAGRSWTKYAGNPVLDHIAGGNRDPKVIWHEPSKKWILALYVDQQSSYGLFCSPDLKHWTPLQRLTLPGQTECPDFFPIALDGEREQQQWVFTTASGHYLVGKFDGTRFSDETGPQAMDEGGNFYAVQTYSDIPASDGRRIQISWMRDGRYPRMPFNGQMSFPCELTLHTTPDGPRLYHYPVKEIETLRDGPPQSWHDAVLPAGEARALSAAAGLADITADIDLAAATGLRFTVHGEPVQYSCGDHRLSCLGHFATVVPINGHLRLRILVDRTSLEIYANDGQKSLTSCFLPDPANTSLQFAAEGGDAKIASLTVYALRSAWSR